MFPIVNDHDYCSPNKGSNTTVKTKTSAPITAAVTEQEQQQDSVAINEKREKRQRKEVYDPEFSHYTSSEYSSSEEDAASDQESDDDPDKPWCLCRKPFGDMFMIECDICKYWYHGHCVGVTQSMSARFEREKREWFCPECHAQIQNGTPRNAIPLKVVEKKKETKRANRSSVHGKRGRGRPRKSETLSREVASRFSMRNARKSSSSADPKISTRRSSKPEARSESYEEFDNNERLKELIRERKKEFFYKRSLAEQQKAAKMRELGLGGRQSLTAPSLSNSLDSLASSTSTPNMNNLPINIKSEHKERSKPNIVLQINTKKDSPNDSSNQRLVTTIVKTKKRKHSESSEAAVSDLFTAEPIQISKKNKEEAAQESSDATNGDRKVTPSARKKTSTSEQSEKSVTSPQKKRKDSESSTTNGSSTPIGSKTIALRIKDNLEERSKLIKDVEVPCGKIEQLAVEIESELSKSFKEGSPKYLKKYRSLVFNLRDSKNETLLKNVLIGEISPARLVNMSHDEMASQELAKWRERENKHSIELIKRDAQLAAQQVIVKKTHKGEEVIAAPSLNDPDDPTAVVGNQEPPTTPTKSVNKEIKVSPSSDGSKSGQFKSPTPSNASQEVAHKADNKSRDLIEASTSIADSLTFLDTTKDHQNHVFDMNCKYCTKQMPEDQGEVSKSEEFSTTSAEPESQPKRFRVSIETKLDPTNLSRLTEPLIKPSENSPDAEEYSPSRVTPTAHSNSNDGIDDEEDELYDPEFVPEQDKSTDDFPQARVLDPNEPCWSGTIMMPDVGKFSATAKPVSGDVNFMREEVSKNLMVCGRIAPDQINSYIKKIRSTSKNPTLLIQLHPSTDNDKANFDILFDYLYSRNRCGVINNSAHPQVLKDFYIIPIHEKGNIPEILKPITGPGLDRKEPNCLLGLLLKSHRPNSAT